MASNKRTGFFQATGGIINTYKLLLGDRVIRDATKEIGSDKLKEFLKIQHKYDLLVQKNPALDPLRTLDPDDIPVFDGFEQYTKWLGTIARTLKVLSNPLQKEMYKLITAMISIAETHKKVQAASDTDTDTEPVALAKDSYILDDKIVTARVKEANEYDWFSFTGKRSVTIIHGNGKTNVTLEPKTRFGMRPSSNGKYYRLVTEDTGLTRVFTLDAKTHDKLLKYSKAAKQPDIEYRVAANTTALDTVTDSELVQAIAGVHFHANHFVSSLKIPVNIRNTTKLPSIYPSWENTMQVVSAVAKEKHYEQRLNDTLTEMLRAKLETLSLACERQRGIRARSVPELVAEAHEYLIDHGWMQYDLENVAQASYNFAVAGVQHRVTTKGQLVELEQPHTYAYAFLGVALEGVLRKAVVSLIREVVNGTVLAGYTAGFDVVCACASTLVQQTGRDWLNNVSTMLR
jgi:hypothetical protein